MDYFLSPWCICRSSSICILFDTERTWHTSLRSMGGTLSTEHDFSASSSTATPRPKPLREQFMRDMGTIQNRGRSWMGLPKSSRARCKLRMPPTENKQKILRSTTSRFSSQVESFKNNFLLKTSQAFG